MIRFGRGRRGPSRDGGGKARYPLEPSGLAEALGEFVEELGVNVVGGCCGTTFEHLRQVTERISDQQSRPRSLMKDQGSRRLKIPTKHIIRLSKKKAS